MIFKSLVLARAFAKKINPSTNFTELEKKKLENVFLDDDIAKYFNWKRYPVNEQVTFQGEADIINWENRKIGVGDVTKARELSEIEQLDLVLVRKVPPVVRLMNYKNFILRWAFKDRLISTSKQTQQTQTIIKIYHKISESDLSMKINNLIQILKNKNIVIVECDIYNPENLEEAKNSSEFAQNLGKKIKSMAGEILVNFTFKPEKNVNKIILKVEQKHKIFVENLEIDLAVRSGQKKIETLNQVKFEDEDEFMNSILSGKFEPETNFMKKIIEKEAQIRFDENYSEKKIDENNIKQKIRKLLGEELSYKFFKGRKKI